MVNIPHVKQEQVVFLTEMVMELQEELTAILGGQYKRGDFDSQEQSVMIGLYKQHMNDITVDELVGKIPLEFEEDDVLKYLELDPYPYEKSGVMGMLSVFKNRFVKRSS